MAARVAGDPALRERLGANGRAAYEARYTERGHLGAYLGLVAELAAARGEAELAELAGQAARREASAA